MDEYVKQSIEARRQAIFASYEVDEGMRARVDELFGEIEELGSKCGDAGEFEAKFATSPLNQRYLDLFTEIATGAVSKQAAGQAVESVARGAVRGAARGVVNEAAGAVGDAAGVAGDVMGGVVPTTRAAVHQKAYDAVRDVPVVGDAIDIGQKAGYVAHLGKVLGFGRKRKGEE